MPQDFSLKKPDIDPDLVMDDPFDQASVEDALKYSGRKLIDKDLTPAKNDYVGDKNRGTVEFNPDVNNYSFHKIAIDDGTIIREKNFSQDKPHTKIIKGKNLTFISCNLVNCEVDPSWTLIDCNNVHITRDKISSEITPEGDTKDHYSVKVEKNGVFVEIAQDIDFIPAIKGAK